MLPTTGPYMLKDTFAQTLCGQAAPQHANVWELSRFALGAHEGRAHHFCQTAVLMMERAVEFALNRGVTQFVTVTTVAIERLFKGLGVPTRRFGKPVQVGIERTVAFSIEVDLNTLVLLRRHTGSRSAAAAMVA
jgi:acyl homoserine lactone synthase